MKLILLTPPDFFVEEDKILTSLFEEGLDYLHLRKPDSEPIYSERLLTLIPEEYHKQIVTHDFFYLKEEFRLKGIHLNQRNPDLPAGYKGHVSRSCHSMEELVQHKKDCSYLFLSPIYDSISKSEYRAVFTAAELEEAARKGQIDKKVMALGGVTMENIPQLKDYGFGGVVILGDLWNRFNIHSTRDYKEVISHFRKLRKAVS
ncbi:MAG: thiamine phosphate synthase [Paraprevotella sp.]|nr:thiamine phosphate synthase [Paraprevotella sp.]